MEFVLRKKKKADDVDRKLKGNRLVGTLEVSLQSEKICPRSKGEAAVRCGIEVTEWMMALNAT